MQESVHLFDILRSDFKTINISVIIAYKAHKIQLSETGNYRGLKLRLRSHGERTDNACGARYNDHQKEFYRNFRPFTRAADYPHRLIIAYGEKKSTDHPHWWITRTLCSLNVWWRKRDIKVSFQSFKSCLI